VYNNPVTLKYINHLPSHFIYSFLSKSKNDSHEMKSMAEKIENLKTIETETTRVKKFL